MIKTSQIAKVRESIAQWRSEGKRISFVPTMGNLHQGHLALVEKAKDNADYVVVSIFVNPMQFDKTSDLSRYPRTLDEDVKKLKNSDTDLLFVPHVETIYLNQQTASFITVPLLGDMLEGESRVGHFNGVATIVCKLFNIVMPNVAFFGEKDYQQLMLIRKLVNDLNIDIEIVGIPTVRESDGLAMSSRNHYLLKEERKKASQFYKILLLLVKQLKRGDITIKLLECNAMRLLKKEGFKPIYIQVRRQIDLQKPNNNNTKLIVLGAVWLGTTRLIDNICFTLNK